MCDIFLTRMTPIHIPHSTAHHAYLTLHKPATPHNNMFSASQFRCRYGRRPTFWSAGSTHMGIPTHPPPPNPDTKPLNQSSNPNYRRTTQHRSIVLIHTPSCYITLLDSHANPPHKPSSPTFSEPYNHTIPHDPAWLFAFIIRS